MNYKKVSNEVSNIINELGKLVNETKGLGIDDELEEILLRLTRLKIAIIMAENNSDITRAIHLWGNEIKERKKGAN